MCQSKAQGGKRCKAHLQALSKRGATTISEAHVQSTSSFREDSSRVSCPNCGTDYARGSRPAHRCKRSNLLILSSASRSIISAIEKAGGRPIFVGGSVRDALMSGEEISSKDIDIEVYRLDINSLTNALAKVGYVNEVGKAFSVLKMTLNGEDFDVSLPRVDSKLGTGHTGFSVTVDSGLDEIAAFARRDFTINAIGWDPLNEELVDPYGGQADIKLGILRHVSPAFREDPLRVLRGVQFAGRFNFSMAEETLLECRIIKDSFKELSTERIWTEWEKLALKAETPSRSLQTLYDVQWEEHFPELAAIRGIEQGLFWHPEGTVDKHVALAADVAASIARRDSLDKQDALVLVLAAIAHDFGKSETTEHTADGHITSRGHAEVGAGLAESFLERLGSPEIIKKHVSILVKEHMAHVAFQNEKPSKKAVIRLMRRLEGNGNGPGIEQWARLVDADCLGRGGEGKSSPSKEWLDIARGLNSGMKAPSTMLTGEHLIDLGLKPGPKFKEILTLARDAQDDGLFDNEPSALTWVKEYIQKSQQ